MLNDLDLAPSGQPEIAERQVYGSGHNSMVLRADQAEA
jgi:hypothetical protein